MCGIRRVLALLALHVGLAHSFSWDIDLGGSNGLVFFNNGTVTHSENIPLVYIAAVAYDPVRNRVIYSSISASAGIYSFDIATKKIETLVRCDSDGSFKFTYDPVTETLFWIVYYRICSFSLKPGAQNYVDGNVLFETHELASGIAVDSCGGYIYWTTESSIQRARFDGSGRVVVLKSSVDWRLDLAIDQQTQTIYWIDKYLLTTNTFNLTVESSDLNGNNRKTLHSESIYFHGVSITISNDFIYWMGFYKDTFWRIPKNPPHQFVTSHKKNCTDCDSIAANYKLEDQTRGSKTCRALTSLIPSTPKNITEDVSLLCVHGTKVIGESVCKCTQGYTGERCDVFICQNYCLHGDCSVSNDRPICRCKAGYSGNRCEVNACQGYCLNNGHCSLNEESNPVCDCAGGFEGERCDVSIFLKKCIQTVSMLKDILTADVTLSTVDKGVKSTYTTTVV